MSEDNITESWLCIDCGVNTAPGFSPGPAVRELLRKHDESLREHGQVPKDDDVIATTTIDKNTEVYMVRAAIWKKAGMEPFGGCLCIGCLEKRLGRKLKQKDFDFDNAFNWIPIGTPRLLKRRGKMRIMGVDKDTLILG